MRSRAAFLIALLAAGLVAAPGEARPRKLGSQAEARRGMAIFGACMVERYRREAAAVLAIEPGGGVAHQAANKISLKSHFCVNDIPRAASLRFDPVFLRGSVAEALYLDEFPRRPVGSLSGAHRFEPPLFANPDPNLSPEQRQLNTAVYAFTQCVAASRPDLVYDLIKSLPASTAEGRAMQALRPELGNCYPAGATLRVNPPMLRAFLAESLYHVSVRHRDAGGPAAPAVGSKEAEE